MTSSIVQSGSEIALEIRDNHINHDYIAGKIVSLHDLLLTLKERQVKEYAMLNSTSNKLAQFFERQPSEISLDAVTQERETFIEFLRSHRYKKNSVRSYANYVNILLDHAVTSGWTASPLPIPEIWRPLLNRAKGLKKDGRCEKLIYCLIKKGLTPAGVQESDLLEWSHAEMKKGSSYAKTQTRIAWLRRILSEAGYTANIKTNRVRKDIYGISLNDCPEPLRTEIHEVLRWKQDRFVPGRPKYAQVRSVTARGIKSDFTRLYGFAVKVAGINNISHIHDLVTEEIVGSYVSWCLNERRVKGYALASTVGSMGSALSQNPKYAHITGEWMTRLVNSIPDDDGGEATRL